MSDVIGTAKIVTEVDSTGVEVGVNKAKRSLADLGTSGAAAGKKASAGVGSIGDSGGKAAQKVEAATKNMIGSIQRTIAAMEAGSKSGSEYYKVLAGQRGIDINTLKPYLDQLDAAAAKQGRAGVTAAQMTNNLRMVGPQVTDIVTSLQAGQNPLTVFIQQGGQLKDVFGGIAPAAKALGGYLVGLINPFTLAAAGAAALAIAYAQGSKEADAYSKALILSGNAAGTTNSQLGDMAKRIDGVIGTQAAAAAALAQFAANGDIAAASLERFTTIALKMERDTGQAVKETVKQFAELGKSPVEAAIKLNETTNFLTTSLYQQIKALDDQGRTADAAALAQKAYADEMESRTAQLEERLGTLERGWNGIEDAAKEAWDAMLNVGRPETDTQRLDALNEKIAASQAKLAALSGPPGASGFERTANAMKAGVQRTRLDALVDERTQLQENIRLSTWIADLDRQKAEQTKAAAQWDKDGLQFMTNQAKMAREITKAQNEGIAAGKKQEDIDKRVADITAKYKDKGAISAGIQLDKAKLGLDVDKVKAQLAILADSYKNTETVLEAQRSAGLISEKDYYDKKRELIQENTNTEVKGLEDEAARIKASKATGAAGIENQRKLVEIEKSITIAKADAVAKRGALDLQQKKSIDQVTLSYLTARQAAQAYFDTQLRQQQRSLSGLGQGAQRRNFDAGVNQIEDRYSGQRLALENQQAVLRAQQDGRLTAEQQRQYKQRLSIINEFQSKSIASYADYYADLIKKQGDWSLGASEGLNNYLDDSRNVFKQTENFVSDAFGGMEDALVNFVRTGKLNFGDLADTIIADLARMEIKALETKLFGGSNGGGGILSALLGGLGGGDAYTSNLPSQSSLASWASSVSAKGNAFYRGQIAAFASGGTFTNGIATQPTLAPMALFGEAGPEAIMPLTRGSDGSLGVKSNGGGQTIKLTYAPVTHVDSRTDQREVEAMIERGNRRGQAQLVDQLRRARLL